jgi:hypothetical protein
MLLHKIVVSLMVLLLAVQLMVILQVEIQIITIRYLLMATVAMVYSIQVV